MLLRGEHTRSLVCSLLALPFVHLSTSAASVEPDRPSQLPFPRRMPFQPRGGIHSVLLHAPLSQCRVHFFPSTGKNNSRKSAPMFRNASDQPGSRAAHGGGRGQLTQNLQTQNGGHPACCTTVRTHRSAWSLPCGFPLHCDWVLCSVLKEARAAFVSSQQDNFVADGSCPQPTLSRLVYLRERLT